MREIKFRAWDNGDKNFIYFTIEEIVSELGWDYGLSKKLLRLMSEDVDISKKQEYTGLKDKNGKEIYEGDKLKNLRGDIVTVKYHEASFKIEGKAHQLQHLERLDFNNWEVIDETELEG